MNTNNIIPMHQIGFPINIENIISDSDSVRVLYDVMEGLDYSELNRTYSTIGRNPDIKVRTEFLLMAIGYNINKLYHKTIQNRNGELLHKQQAS